MRRGAFAMGFVVAASTAMLILPAAGPAVAGGGCHAHLTQGTGNTIEMRDACFTPSILRVDPGSEVTFVNKDPMGHNIWANGWGHFDDMLHGDTYTAGFAQPGIYPFACAYHPGMTGAVVVGEGVGAGSGEHVSVASASEDAAPAAQARPAAATAQEGQGRLGWVVGGAIGLVLGAGLALLLRRRSATVER
jgi:plastocyanin